MEMWMELDLGEIEQWSKSKESELPGRAYRLTFDSTNDVRNAMMDTTPVRCGFNKNSHVADVISWNYGIAYSDAPYYPYIILGRGPVVAVNARALAIRTNCGGGVIFRKSAGPAKANDYRPRAVQRAQSDIQRHGTEFEKWYVT
jgi:hypothetical protein